VNSTGNDIVALAAIDKLRTRQYRFYSKILSDAERTLFDGLQPAGMPFENFVWLLWSIKESIYKYLKRTQPGLVFSPTRTGIRTITAPERCFGEGSPLQWESRVAGCGKDAYRGIAFFESHIFYFRSRIHPDCIATVVGKEENFENTWWGVRSIGHPDAASQSAAVRTLALNQLKAVLSAGRLPAETSRPDMAAGAGVGFVAETMLHPDAMSRPEPMSRPDTMPGPDAIFRSGAMSVSNTWQIRKSPLGYPLVFQGEEEMTIPLSLAHHANFIAYSFHLDPHLQQANLAIGQTEPGVRPYFSREGRSVIS